MDYNDILEQLLNMKALILQDGKDYVDERDIPMLDKLIKIVKEKGDLIMDERALKIVEDYAKAHLDKSDGEVSFDTYIVWKAKALQNWKYLISTTLLDGMYYELTFNGDKNEWYLDAYKKFENKVIPN